MGTVLWWVAALLCHQRCCEKVCGRCESCVEGVQALAVPRRHCRTTADSWLSLPCTKGTLLDGKMGLHSTGRDLLIPGETLCLGS